MNQRRNAGAHKERYPRSLGHRFENVFELLPGGLFQAVRHQSHTEKEQAQPPYRPENHRPNHFPVSALECFPSLGLDDFLKLRFEQFGISLTQHS